MDVRPSSREARTERICARAMQSECSRAPMLQQCFQEGRSFPPAQPFTPRRVREARLEYIGCHRSECARGAEVLAFRHAEPARRLASGGASRIVDGAFGV